MLKNRIIEIVIGIAVTMLLTSTAFGGGQYTSGHAVAHDGSQIYYEVHGTGRKFLLFGFQLQPGAPTVQQFVEGLGQDYKLVLARYPGGAREARMYSLTPAAVARDYLAVADAVGADEFAFYGYSWGAVCGLQLAIRSPRLKALVAGGFPMIDGPYPDMLKTLRLRVIEHVQSDSAREFDRQILTFYEGLQSFDDRSVQSELRIPRLNFVGTEDSVTFPGNVHVEFFKIFDHGRKELTAAGWQVVSLTGKNHSTGSGPDVVVPLVRNWLGENWRDER